MKRTIAFLLVLALLISMTACADGEAETTHGTTLGQTQSATEDTHETESTTISGAAEETTAGVSEQEGTKPAETEPQPTEGVPVDNPQNNSTTGNQPHSHRYSVAKTVKIICTGDETITYKCECGQSYTQQIAGSGKHNWDSWYVHVKATHTAKGEERRYCKSCVAFETREIPMVKVRMHVGWEIVETNIINPYICRNGQELLTRMFGENQAFKPGDSITIRVKMSDGSYATESDFKDYYKDSKFDLVGCTYSMSGDRIRITFNNDFTNGEGVFGYTVKNSDGTLTSKAIVVHLTQTSDLTDGTVYINYEFIEYAKLQGLTHITGGLTFSQEYSKGYTWGNEALSITGCTINGTDDEILYEGNPDWIDDMIDLIDTYRSMGFNVWSLERYYTGLATLADYSDKVQ